MKKKRTRYRNNSLKPASLYSKSSSVIHRDGVSHIPRRSASGRTELPPQLQYDPEGVTKDIVWGLKFLTPGFRAGGGRGATSRQIALILSIFGIFPDVNSDDVAHVLRKLKIHSGLVNGGTVFYLSSLPFEIVSTSQITRKDEKKIEGEMPNVTTDLNNQDRHHVEAYL